jgi:hypothetical protein
MYHQATRRFPLGRNLCFAGRSISGAAVSMPEHTRMQCGKFDAALKSRLHGTGDIAPGWRSALKRCHFPLVCVQSDEEYGPLGPVDHCIRRAAQSCPHGAS